MLQKIKWRNELLLCYNSEINGAQTPWVNELALHELAQEVKPKCHIFVFI